MHRQEFAETVALRALPGLRRMTIFSLCSSAPQALMSPA